ncbi:glycosyltransferase family 1 protein [Myriangium duriaei CBS 260.36]|uniref:Glycosyltransferase family 1 protein n=1 Tax=Myriangium duriaei CBS 260.36 TaxID=1168546 RepID=A0A9P4IXX2_9PEZI|nr:glycosyltransferase family 1 protein [Myriangium duriaei CBS 260.36]
MSDHLYRSASHVSRTLWPQDPDFHDDGRLNIGPRGNSFFQKHLPHTRRSATEHTKQKNGQTRRPLARLRVNHHDYSFKPPVQDFKGKPRMNIAILIVGSRGDVQPFIALGRALREPPYNHRVRICTHPNFKDFVEENGLEFFSIGGDPEKLMSYMVRNPGIIPSLASIKAGDVGARRREIEEMLQGCWRACTEAGNGIDPVQAEHRYYEKGHEEDIFNDLPAPFVADAIISNPPAYAAIHIAEKLGAPLHMMFTMPWSPTSAFSHPLANIDQSRADVRFANYMSFYQVELLTWEGLVDLINKFREKTLFLDAIDPAWGYILMPYLKVPFTYFWSPALIPKPADWGDHITISGFQFLSLASSFKPPSDLQEFLDAGPPPVYIGFGSIVVDDPNKLSTMVLEAVKQTGVRALVSKGWGNLGGQDIPDNVFLLGNVPHDWLFPRCSAVVHHGGAGTTAIGIALGKPTVVVPFFGDQPWWGNMVYRAGAGPEPVPYKDMTAEKLADSLRKALEPEVQERAHELSSKIQNETGAETAAQQFHDTPQMQNLSCFLCPDQVAVWRVKRTNIRLSPLAAAVLVVNGRIKADRLKLVRHKMWTVEEGAQDPLVALIASVSTTIIGYVGDARQFTQDLSEPKSQRTSTSDQDSPVIAQPKTSRSRRTAKATANFAGSVTARTAKIPLTLLYNLANGFHNAPLHLLNDHTVRVRGHITGLTSGLATALTGGANELIDGVAGVYRLPAHSVRHKRADGHGVAMQSLALGTGVVRGVGSLVLKTCAAATGVAGYTLKGVEREAERWMTGADESDEVSGEYMARAMEWLGRERVARGEEEEGTRRVPLERVRWAKRRGAAAMRRITERRAWESLSELHALKVRGGERAVEMEREILRGWDGLEVPERFV